MNLMRVLKIWLDMIDGVSFVMWDFILILSKLVTRQIISEMLGYQKEPACWVPKQFTKEQKFQGTVTYSWDV